MRKVTNIFAPDNMLQYGSRTLAETQPTALQLVGADPSTEIIRQNRADALERREARAKMLGNAVAGAILTAPLIPVVGAMWAADAVLRWREERHA